MVLSVDECRKLVSGSDVSDDQLLAIREQLYALAEVAVDAGAHGTEGASGRGAAFGDFVRRLEVDDREALEERAAIREYDGGESRDAAKSGALLQYMRKRREQS